MYHPLGPEVDLSTTTEEEETTEEKATTGKFLAMPCFVSIFDLQFSIIIDIICNAFICFIFRRANHNDNDCS